MLIICIINHILIKIEVLTWLLVEVVMSQLSVYNDFVGAKTQPTDKTMRCNET